MPHLEIRADLKIFYSAKIFIYFSNVSEYYAVDYIREHSYMLFFAYTTAGEGEGAL